MPKRQNSSTREDSPRAKKKSSRRELARLKLKLLELERKFTLNDETSTDATDEDSDRNITPNSSEPELSDQPYASQRASLDPAIITALGTDLSTSVPIGQSLRDEIVIHWTIYLQTGLDKATRAEVTQKYPLPPNCTALAVPKLNSEIQQCLNETPLKQDVFLSRLQQQIAHGISALGGAMDTLILNPRKEAVDILPQLADGAQLLADVHHSLSVYRKFLVTPLLNADCKKVIENCEITDNLFGSNFQDKVKPTQAMKKAASEMKAVPLPKKKPLM